MRCSVIAEVHAIDAQKLQDHIDYEFLLIGDTSSYRIGGLLLICIGPGLYGIVPMRHFRRALEDYVMAADWYCREMTHMACDDATALYFCFVRPKITSMPPLTVSLEELGEQQRALLKQIAAKLNEDLSKLAEINHRLGELREQRFAAATAKAAAESTPAPASGS